MKSKLNTSHFLSSQQGGSGTAAIGNYHERAQGTAGRVPGVLEMSSRVQLPDEGKGHRGSRSSEFTYIRRAKCPKLPSEPQTSSCPLHVSGSRGLFSTVLSLFFLLVCFSIFFPPSLPYSLPFPSSFLAVFCVEPRVSAKCYIPSQHYLNLFSFISVFSTEMEAGPQVCQESALPPSAILSSNLGFSTGGSKNMALKLKICIRITNKWFTICVHVCMYVHFTGVYTVISV